MLIIAAVTLSLAASPAHPVAKTVFRGRPVVKIQEDGVSRDVEKVTSEKAVGFECVISRIGETFYWASRDNRVLLLHESPGYLTFVAEDATGYVKVVLPEAKKALGDMKPTEAAFDYLEHVPFGLTTITYYGTAGKW